MAQPRAAAGACPALGALLTLVLPRAGPRCAGVSFDRRTIEPRRRQLTHSLRAVPAAPGRAPGAAPGAAQVHRGCRAGCRAPHPDWLSRLPWELRLPLLLWEFLAAACALCKTPGGIFSAGRSDVYRSGREHLCSQGSVCVCVKGRWSIPPALGQGTQGAGSCCTMGLGVAARGTHAGLLPPGCLLGWVGSGSRGISGQRFTNGGHSFRLLAPKACLQ